MVQNGDSKVVAGPGTARAAARFITIPDCRIVGALTDRSEIWHRFRQLRKCGLPYIQKLGRYCLASNVPIGPLAETPCLAMILGPTIPEGHLWSARLDDLQRICRSCERAAIIRVDTRHRSVWLFRDWTGALPLYYALSSEAAFFATRIAPLIALKVRPNDIVAAPPGHVCNLSTASSRTTVHSVQALHPIRAPQNRVTVIQRVRNLIEQAVNRFQDEHPFILLSGGVDSTILAYLLQRRIKKLDAIVMSLDRPNGRLPDKTTDLYMARRAARWLGIRLHEIILSPADAARVVPEVISTAETRRASLVDELAGMYHVARYLRHKGVTTLYTGEGPDDIFGGLEFQLRFTPMHQLHQRMRLNFSVDLPLELAAAQKLFSDVGGIQLYHPFLFRPLVQFAFGISPRALIDSRRKMKVLFRSAFAHEIPEDLLWREKAITRVATGLRTALEAKYGTLPTRYYNRYNAWLTEISEL